MRVIRWALLLPAALIAAVLVTFPMHWLALAIRSTDGNPLSALPLDVLERLLYAFAVPYFFVLAAAFFSPIHRAKVGAIACVAVGIVAAMLLAWFVGQEDLAIAGPDWARVITPALWGAGLLCAYFVTRKADKWDWPG